MGNHVDAQIPEGIIKLDEVDFDTDNWKDYEPDDNKVKNKKATHYELWKDFEAIDIIQNSLSMDEYIGYLKGNILKYRLRTGFKDNAEKDVEKAKDYRRELDALIVELEELEDM
jgi:hypothetical protein